MLSLIGLPIGLYGYLFPGNINLMVLHLYGAKRHKMLLAVLTLVVIFESLYCLVTLLYLKSIKSNIRLSLDLEIVAYILVFIMGSWMMFENKSEVKVTQNNTLYRGLFNIVIHPQQIPFWIVIGIIIDPILHLGSDWKILAGFIFSNALGTLLIMFIYMIYGNKLMQYFKLRLSQVNTAIGLLYIATAVFSLCRILIH